MVPENSQEWFLSIEPGIASEHCWVWVRPPKETERWWVVMVVCMCVLGGEARNAIFSRITMWMNTE